MRDDPRRQHRLDRRAADRRLPTRRNTRDGRGRRRRARSARTSHRSRQKPTPCGPRISAADSGRMDPSAEQAARIFQQRVIAFDARARLPPPSNRSRLSRTATTSDGRSKAMAVIVLSCGRMPQDLLRAPRMRSCPQCVLIIHAKRHRAQSPALRTAPGGFLPPSRASSSASAARTSSSLTPRRATVARPSSLASSMPSAKAFDRRMRRRRQAHRFRADDVMATAIAPDAPADRIELFC